MGWLFARHARVKAAPLPVTVYSHASLIRRALGNVDMILQENKAINLALSAPHISGVLIRPGETFSFWHLVGKTSRARGYREGLTLSAGKTSQGVGGGLCQFTNLLHWMVLHSPLDISEHHHHDRFDLFPDFGRVIPFGTGTSIMYNYLDYQLKNSTDTTFQFVVWVDETHLRGELRADRPTDYSYHIREEDARFVREGDTWYRENTIWRDTIEKRTGQVVESARLKANHARVMYSEKHIDPTLIEISCEAQSS